MQIIRKCFSTPVSIIYPIKIITKLLKFTINKTSVLLKDHKSRFVIHNLIDFLLNRNEAIFHIYDSEYFYVNESEIIY